MEKLRDKIPIRIGIMLTFSQFKMIYIYVKK